MGKAKAAAKAKAKAAKKEKAKAKAAAMKAVMKKAKAMKAPMKASMKTKKIVKKLAETTPDVVSILATMLVGAFFLRCNRLGRAPLSSQCFKPEQRTIVGSMSRCLNFKPGGGREDLQAE